MKSNYFIIKDYNEIKHLGQLSKNLTNSSNFKFLENK